MRKRENRSEGRRERKRVWERRRDGEREGGITVCVSADPMPIREIVCEREREKERL